MVKLLEEKKAYDKAGKKSACWYPKCKRGMDILLSATGLLLSFPLFLLIAFGIRVTSPGPIFFRQVRMGRGLEPFLLYKFRTMTCRAPRDAATGSLCGSEKYITRFGSFLRKTSLDELPQLWNVLRGEMSLIGPRPVVLSETDLITRRIACGAYGVRPGMSGLSQIRGRDLLSNEEKATFDGTYARHMSLLGDIGLLLATALCVLSRRGVRDG